MKTKILKSEGYYKLILDEQDINDKNLHGSPILLACITNYANTGHWSFSDYRLSKNLIPSKFLIQGNETVFNFSKKSIKDQKLILSKIKHYQHDVEKDYLFYHQYNCDDLNGNLDLQSINQNKEFKIPPEFCFSFDSAYQKLRDTKLFWTNYSGNISNPQIQIPNPFRQPSVNEFFFELEENQYLLKKNKI